MVRVLVVVVGCKVLARGVVTRGRQVKRVLLPALAAVRERARLDGAGERVRGRDTLGRRAASSDDNGDDDDGQQQPCQSPAASAAARHIGAVTCQ